MKQYFEIVLPGLLSLLVEMRWTFDLLMCFLLFALFYPFILPNLA